jgi:hypothetical protein
VSDMATRPNMSNKEMSDDRQGKEVYRRNMGILQEEAK